MKTKHVLATDPAAYGGGIGGSDIDNDLLLLCLGLGRVDHEHENDECEGNQNGCPKFSSIVQYISNERALKI
jgi:hypothetical protein